MTMAPRRNRIGVDLMEALQMMKFSTRQGRGLSELDFTSRYQWTSELEELESEEMEALQVPQESDRFIYHLRNELIA